MNLCKKRLNISDITSVLILIITSSVCKCEGRFFGADTPPHWPWFEGFQIHSKESKKENIFSHLIKKKTVT